MCGCNKKNFKPKQMVPPKGSFRQNNIPKSFQQQPVQNLNSNGLSAEKRKTQAIRRDQIKKALQNRNNIN